MDTQRFSRIANGLKSASISSVTQTADALRREGKEVLVFSIGRPDFDTPEHIKAAANDALAKGFVHYTHNRGILPMREAVAAYLKRQNGLDYDPKTEIMITAGAQEALMLCTHALLDPGDEVLVPSPGFLLYYSSIPMLHAVPVPYVLKEPDYDWDGAPVSDRTKLMIFNNPNNPTGSVYPREVLEGIVEVARRHQLMIFADEIYDRLCMDGYEHVSIASLAPDLPCVTFSGLSKSHMIAGYRIGWMVLSGNQRCMSDFIMGINMLSNMRLCSNVPAQSIVQTALGGHQSVNDYIRPGGRVYEQRNFVYEALNKIDGISVVKPRAAFYIFPKMDVKKFNITDDEQFALDLLHEKKILITRGGGFNWAEPDHFRIVYLPRMEVLKESLEDLADFFDHYRQA